MKGLRASLALLVVAASLLFFSVPVADNDLWGHVAFGRRVLADGLPTKNEYSYTEPDHPWINHEILAECSFAALYNILGSGGLLALKWICGLSTLAILGRIARRRGAGLLATASVLVFAASLMAWGYNIRPQIFTFLFLAILWDALDGMASGGGTRRLWRVPLLFVVWINTHGGVLAGAAILTVSTALLAPRIRSRSERIMLGAVVAASLAALLLNPYGWRLLAFLLQDVTIDRPISEWEPIAVFALSNLQFKIAVLLSVLGFLHRDWRDCSWEAVVISAAAVATFRHERHLPLFAVVAIPHLAVLVSRILDKMRLSDGALGQDRTARSFVAVGAITLAIAMATPSFRIHRELDLGISVPNGAYPVGAVEFLRGRGIGGNLAVPFGWGEYAIWHLYPAFRVSIDGRYTTAYSLETIDLGWRYLDGGEGWDRHLELADVAIADSRHVTGRLLDIRSGWRRVYTDATASVFARDGLKIDPMTDAADGRLLPSLFP